MAYVLRGRVVTFDDDQRVLNRGSVYVGDDGKLAAVSATGETAPSGFAGAPRIDTRALIYPGLIDLHSHMAYNTLPLWEAVGVPYLHHDRWIDEDHPPEYASSITWPTRVLQQAAAQALIKYVEVKALIGGTTSIQGAPRTTRPVDGWLVRVVDNERFGGSSNLVRCAAIQQPTAELRTTARSMRDRGGVLIYHVAEGKTGTIVHDEFKELRDTGCLRPGLIGVHATALTADDFRLWQSRVTDLNADQEGTVVWSPFSNLWLYHQTTDVLAARAQKLRITLGSDWSPSGTKHVLGELKVADILNKRHLHRAFGDAELCAMVTANPGDALAPAGARIGRLVEGAEADVIVVGRNRANPYRNLIRATERDIKLVVVRGLPFYGLERLMTAAKAGRTNAITIAGEKRAVVVKMPGRLDATLNWPQVIRTLEKVRKDPVAAWNASVDALAAWGGPLDAPEAPLLIFGEMPEGDVGLLGATGEIPLDTKIPPLDSLEHDAAFFAAINRTAAPDLDRLASYYR
jgi:cytosine/adenosine deaminase-related metal-dependent hydrolase